MITDKLKADLPRISCSPDVFERRNGAPNLVPARIAVDCWNRMAV